MAYVLTPEKGGKGMRTKIILVPSNYLLNECLCNPHGEEVYLAFINLKPMDMNELEKTDMLRAV